MAYSICLSVSGRRAQSVSDSDLGSETSQNVCTRLWYEICMRSPKKAAAICVSKIGRGSSPSVL